MNLVCLVFFFYFFFSFSLQASHELSTTNKCERVVEVLLLELLLKLSPHKFILPGYNTHTRTHTVGVVGGLVLEQRNCQMWGVARRMGEFWGRLSEATDEDRSQ